MSLQKRKKLKKISFFIKMLLVSLLITHIYYEKKESLLSSEEKNESTSQKNLAISTKTPEEEPPQKKEIDAEIEKAIQEQKPLLALKVYEENYSSLLVGEKEERLLLLEEKIYKEVFHSFRQKAQQSQEQENWDEAQANYLEAEKFWKKMGNRDEAFLREMEDFQEKAYRYLFDKGNELLSYSEGEQKEPKFEEALTFFRKSFLFRENKEKKEVQEKIDLCLVNLYLRCEFKIKESDEGYSIFESSFINEGTSSLQDIEIKIALPQKVKILGASAYKERKEKGRRVFYLKIKEIAANDLWQEECLIQTPLKSFTVKGRVKNLHFSINQKVARP